MSKSGLQSCLMNLLSIIAQVPFVVVFLMVLKAANVEWWVYALYLGGAALGWIVALVNVYLTWDSINTSINDAVRAYLDNWA